MKSFTSFLFILFAGVLLSATVNTIAIALHITPQTAPGYVGVRVGGSKATASNANREESSFGDFWIEDKMDRATGFADKIVNDKSNNQIEYPMGW